jgi:sarcosine oxidase, subunit beta
VAAGHSGHGFKLSPAVGHMVADLVTHDHNEDSLDPTPFRLARFREGQPVRGRYAYSIAG